MLAEMPLGAMDPNRILGPPGSAAAGVEVVSFVSWFPVDIPGSTVGGVSQRCVTTLPRELPNPTLRG